ncbi:MAG: hypothetical protein M3Z09_15830, partial [Acidobacteriota bacterium]|nr:hypothetical protein [Acidobacteriota bacterium]
MICYFLFLTHRAIGYDFNPDDVMILNFAISRPLRLNLESCVLFWNGYIRPLGTMFYLLVYRFAGYWALPFRVAAFCLLILNLVLLYRFALALSRSRTIAFLVLLLGCFHGSMWDIYSNTGTIYDLLCQTFSLIAFTAWVQAARPAGWRALAAVTLAAVAAVESKEMGAMVPSVLLAYELIFRKRPIEVRGLVLTAIVAIVFVLSRFVQQTAVTGNPAFTPVVSVSHYLMTTKIYLNFLFFGAKLGEPGAVAVLMSAAALAVVL